MLLRSIRSRLLAAFLLPPLLLLGVAGAAGYAATRELLEEELGKGLASIAAAAAAPVSGERLLGIVAGDDKAQTRTYRNILRQLTEVRDAAQARRVFAFDTRGAMRVDSAEALPVGSEVPELLRDKRELAQVFAGRPAASQVLFEGSDGRLYKTGYAPIYEAGKVVGAVGVEGSAAFFGPLQRLFWSYGALLGSALGVLGLLAVLTSRGLTRPLTRLMSAALRIGRGDLTTEVPPEGTREIGVLAHELEQMRRALRGRDQQLKMMLAGVAHEVRNPIGGIALFAGLLAEELPAGESPAREHVARIEKEIGYLQRIVEDFLAFAREERLARTRVDAAALCEQARELLSAEAAAREVTVTVEAAPAPLDADPSLLLAALVNLVKNAIQASAPGSEVRLGGRQQDGARYLLEVIDRGRGIAPEVQEKIFEPFFTTREQGTGLGLPLARKIAQAHGGQLELHSAPGETCFRLSLPLPTQL